jgi:hypothetical protein
LVLFFLLLLLLQLYLVFLLVLVNLLDLEYLEHLELLLNLVYHEDQLGGLIRNVDYWIQDTFKDLLVTQ